MKFLHALYFYGMAQMQMSPDQFWTMPFGLFMDLWACHKQFLGIEKPYQAQTIDDVVAI